MASKSKICVYCGTTNPETSDHIPPKGLFAKPRPQNLITAPCCSKCNNQSSNDDEYFRNMLALRKEAFEHPDVQEILPKIFKGLSNPRQVKFKESFLKTIRDVDLQSESGIYLGKKASYKVDKQRLCNVAERIVRGLHWKHNDSRIPSEWKLKSYLIEETILSNIPACQTIVRLFKDKSGRQIGAGVFRYWVAESEGNDYEAWWLTFYKQTNFMIVVTRPVDGI